MCCSFMVNSGRSSIVYSYKGDSMRDHLLLLLAVLSFPATLALILAHKLGMFTEVAVAFGLVAAVAILASAAVLAVMNTKGMFK